MPHSIDIGDLVQDGVIGLIDAAHRFDEARGIKFETFAERRIRGAMIDALRKDAWPRGVRRQRRELEAAREELRRELGCEPSLADLAAKMGSDEKRLSRTIVRINAIESTSPLANNENLDESTLPAALIPSEPEQPDTAYERNETKERVRAAIASLPAARAEGHRPLLLRRSDDEADWRRDRRQRVARVAAARPCDSPAARCARGDDAARRGDAGAARRHPGVPTEAAHGEGHARQPRLDGGGPNRVATPAVVVPYAKVSRTARSRSASRNGLASQRQALSSRKRSASVPATSPVTKMTRRASAGVAAAWRGKAWVRTPGSGLRTANVRAAPGCLRLRTEPVWSPQPACSPRPRWADRCNQSNATD